MKLDALVREALTVAVPGDWALGRTEQGSTGLILTREGGADRRTVWLPNRVMSMTPEKIAAVVVDIFDCASAMKDD